MSEPTPQKPQIDYPCQWGFRLIGRDESALRGSIGEVLADEPYVVSTGHESSGGRYRSLHVEITVRDESHRNGIFAAFQSHEAVSYVL